MINLLKVTSKKELMRYLRDAEKTEAVWALVVECHARGKRVEELEEAISQVEIRISSAREAINDGATA